MPATCREQIEWCDIWLTACDSTERRPRVLLIGDSITKGYHRIVEQHVSGLAWCDRVSTSRFVTDPVFFQELALVLGQRRYNVVHFNNGLHGWAHSETQYRDGLPVLVQFLRERSGDASLIWAQSTGMREKASEADYRDGPSPTRISARNRLAADAMRAEGVPVNDLHACSTSRPDLWCPDGIHFGDAGNALLGEQTAEHIRTWLG